MEPPPLIVTDEIKRRAAELLPHAQLALHRTMERDEASDFRGHMAGLEIAEEQEHCEMLERLARGDTAKGAITAADWQQLQKTYDAARQAARELFEEQQRHPEQDRDR